jgi:fructose-bisphosphate aldolase class II
MPLTLHGDSGTDRVDFRGVIEAGMTLVHISAELPGMRRGLEAAFAAEPDNLVPYHLFRKADEAIQEVVVTNRLKLFNRL